MGSKVGSGSLRTLSRANVFNMAVVNKKYVFLARDSPKQLRLPKKGVTNSRQSFIKD